MMMMIRWRENGVSRKDEGGVGWEGEGAERKELSWTELNVCVFLLWYKQVQVRME